MRLLIYILIAYICSNSASSSQVSVVGNSTVSKEHILKRFDKNNINSSIKEIFSMGVFSYISVDNDQQNNYIIDVKESPILNKIYIKGNKTISKDDILKKIDLQENQRLNNSKLENGLKKILLEYKEKGRLNARINVYQESLPDNKINLSIMIKENGKTKISNINFVGNESFSSNILKQYLFSTERNISSFISGVDKYNPTKIDMDMISIKNFYMNHGFVNIRVLDPIIELHKNNLASITYRIIENDILKIADISIENFNLSQKIKLSTKKGDVFNIQSLRDDSSLIANQLKHEFPNKKYSVKVDYENNSSGQVNVKFTIQEEPKKYINKINIFGNSRTNSNVILQQITFAESDQYSDEEIQQSQKNILSLGFFTDVNITSKPSKTDHDLLDVNVIVNENSETGFIKLGGSYTSDNGIMGEFSLTENNFAGTGNTLSAEASRNFSGFNASLDFIYNNFMDRDISLGGLFDIQKHSKNNNDSSYDLSTIGYSFKAFKPLLNNMNLGLVISYKYFDLYNLSESISEIIKNQNGKFDSFTLGCLFNYSSLDNKIRPTSGIQSVFSQNVATLFGKSRYVKSYFSADYFKPILSNISKDITLIFRLKAGGISSYDNYTLKVIEHFTLQEKYIRGFENSKIGPIDAITKDKLGGKFMIASGLQTNFPIGFPKKIGIMGSLFVDAANLFGSDYNPNEVIDENKLRISAGFGVLWYSPLGPVRLDFGFPIVKNKDDQAKSLNISLGNVF